MTVIRRLDAVKAAVLAKKAELDDLGLPEVATGAGAQPRRGPSVPGCLNPLWRASAEGEASSMNRDPVGTHLMLRR